MAHRRRWGFAHHAGPLVIGHRGASAKALENTAAAFRQAAADGADGVELDVLTCATGEVVVFHDDDLARLAGRPERIDALPFAEVRAVALRGGQRIPTLEEAFEACGPDLLLNVELKSSGVRDRRLSALISAVSAILDRTGAAPRVVVSSFSPTAVLLWRRRRPDVSAALLFEANAPLPLRQAWALPLLSPFAAHPEQVLCNEASVRRWHAAGYAVNTWTVDDPARIATLAHMGVDGIISNDPAAARAALTPAAGRVQ